MTDGEWKVSAQLYLEALLAEREKQVHARFVALERELSLYREEMKSRLLLLNELRSEVTKDRDLLLPRETWETWCRERVTWRESVNKQLTAIEARTLTWGAALVAFVTILTLALHFWSATR